jgi:hypothetical protein
VPAGQRRAPLEKTLGGKLFASDFHTYKGIVLSLLEAVALEAVTGALVALQELS